MSENQAQSASENQAQSEVLEGEIFIIPNSIQVVFPYPKDQYGYSCRSTNAEDLSEGPRACFEGWICNDECANWARHSYPRLTTKINDRFPVDLFMGKREGDVVEFLLGGKNVRLRCSQLNHRYANYGNFQDVMYNLTQSFGGIYQDAGIDLTKEQQRELLIDNHIHYARSIDKPLVNPSKFRYP